MILLLKLTAKNNNKVNMDEKDVFNIINKFVIEKGLISHQIESYDHLIEKTLQKIFDEIPTIHLKPKPQIETYIKFGQIYVDYPMVSDENTKKKLYPQEARLRDLIYESSVRVDIYEKIIDSDKGSDEDKFHSKVWIADIPTMIGCCRCNLSNLPTTDKVAIGECEKDIGGYFIIKGKERALVGQERINYNQINIFEQKTKLQKWAHIAEIRSISEETSHSVLVQAKTSLDGKSVVFSLPYIKIDIPAGIVFKALGYESYEDIMSLLGADSRFSKFVQFILISSKETKTKEDALDWIGSNPIHNIIEENKRKEYASQVLENEVFPHLSPSNSREVALCLGMMISKLLYTVIGVRKYDDRDNISLKRVETAGILVGDLFRMNLRKAIEVIKKNINKKPDFVSSIGQNTITNNIRYCFSTGNWGVQKNTYIRTGVSQVLSRLTFSATLSHLRRVVIPIAKDSKNTKTRQLHPTHAFYICPCESPDGQSIGIVKNLAFSSRVTQSSSLIVLRDIIESQKYILSINDFAKKVNLCKILINGLLVGYTENPITCIENLKKLRRCGIIHKDVSISYDKFENQCTLYCDDGRFSRPLLTLENGKIMMLSDKNWRKMGWYDLINKGYVQYLDSYEVENSVIAMTPEELLKYNGKWDYCEIHPSLMLGVSGIVIPYSDHNQSPRNCYQTNMIKQAIGIYSLAYQTRTDTVAYVLDYPQKPLVTSHYAKMLDYDEMPYGINAVVAIACYTGFNQEDSVILNKSSIERGLFCTHSYKTLTIEEKKKNSNNFDTIELPPLSIRNKSFNYTKLDSEGIVKKGSILLKDDVLVGKTLTEIGKDENKEVKTDISISVKNGEEGIVDDVYIINSVEGNRNIKIRIRNIKIPEVGDKFSSRYAQKGVCGMVFPQEDLPFTAQGIVPDIIINSHCIPSRMTVGQLIECILGKKCAMDGTIGDSTPFTEDSRDPVGRISKELKSYGFNRFGNEQMYSGFTGEPLEAEIFIGPTYYQRLKHMVSDKHHCRAMGNVTAMARQPHEGRSRLGGLKLGEMEKDALITHGTSAFLKERLFNMSDPYTVKICKICKHFLTGPDECIRCRNTDEICKVNIPYACKLLIHELNALNIKTEIVTK